MKSPQKSSIVYSLNTKLNFKVIIVGNKYVGKTSLILREIKDIYEENYKVTLGVEFYSKILQDENEPIALQIWDSAGQQHYKSIVKSFYNLANCVILVYDSPIGMTTNLENWLQQIFTHICNQTRVVIVRTKIDNMPIQQEQREKIERIMKKYRIQMFEGVSAKASINIGELFMKIGRLMKYLFENDNEFRCKIDESLKSVTTDGSVLKNKLASIKTKNRKSKCCI